MQRKLYKMCVCLALAICAISAQKIFAAQNVVETKKELQSQELILMVSTEALQFDGNDILVNVNGNTYPVRSLEKNGNQWAAKILTAANYCPSGHLTCRNCGLCHQEKCVHYIRPCRLWN